MKILILIFAFIMSLGIGVKQQVDDIKELKTRAEMNEFKSYPNLLPVVEIVAERN